MPVNNKMENKLCQNDISSRVHNNRHADDGKCVYCTIIKILDMLLVHMDCCVVCKCVFDILQKIWRRNQSDHTWRISMHELINDT